ncbi:toxin-antitoxin system HicB family antitoxin [Singulisphaera sp. Ch08]|uniref:Toxin-antitoxin system HicB family antitoxin n=1 Tax=Singulisphaera sp. Ch08 TaxID=3120278 RepID=A0AAU7CBX9_9BACT
MPETVVHFQIRMPPALHEQLASWAKEDKASLNALIVSILKNDAEKRELGENRASSRTDEAAR